MKNSVRADRVPSSSPLSWLLCALSGAGAGFLNGLLGTAGGILLVTVLPHLTPPPALYPPGGRLGDGHERQDILATTMAVVLPVSAVSAVLYWLGGTRPDPIFLVSLIVPAAAGGLVGAMLLGRLPSRLIKKLFAALVVVSGIRMLF